MTSRDILNRAVLRAVNVDIRLWDAGHALPRELINQAAQENLANWINEYMPVPENEWEEENRQLVTEEKVSACRTILEAEQMISRSL